jgi:hypothetical protein
LLYAAKPAAFSWGQVLASTGMFADAGVRELFESIRDTAHLPEPLSAALVAAALDTKDADVFEALALHPGTPADALLVLSGDRRYGVTRAVAKRRDLPEEAWDRLLRLDEQQTNGALFDNPACPNRIRRHILLQESGKAKSSKAVALDAGLVSRLASSGWSAPLLLGATDEKLPARLATAVLHPTLSAGDQLILAAWHLQSGRLVRAQATAAATTTRAAARAALRSAGLGDLDEHSDLEGAAEQLCTSARELGDLCIPAGSVVPAARLAAVLRDAPSSMAEQVLTDLADSPAGLPWAELTVLVEGGELTPFLMAWLARHPTVPESILLAVAEHYPLALRGMGPLPRAVIRRLLEQGSPLGKPATGHLLRAQIAAGAVSAADLIELYHPIDRLDGLLNSVAAEDAGFGPATRHLEALATDLRDQVSELLTGRLGTDRQAWSAFAAMRATFKGSLLELLDVVTPQR